MNGLLDLSLAGWIASLAAGFAVGGVFFLSIRIQVRYVLEHRGPAWVAPVALYARMVFLAVVLVAVARLVRAHDLGRQVPAMMLAGVIGALVARVLVQRAVGRRREEPPDEEPRDV